MTEIESSDAPRRRRSIFAFSLRTMLLLTGFCALGVFLKLQWDWQQKLDLVRTWVTPLVEAELSIDSGDGQNPIPTPTCPEELLPEDQLALLGIGISHLQEEPERTAAIKVLIELYPESARELLLDRLPHMRYPTTRALSLKLIGLFREPDDASVLMQHLAHDDARVRAAACEALGLIRQPAHNIPLEKQFAWNPAICWMRSDPPIRLNELLVMIRNQQADVGQQPAQPSARMQDMTLPTDRIDVNASVRKALEQRMLQGETAEERTAAARALLTWPPKGYQLRVAEWGVWVNDNDELKLVQSVIDEIPPFVHRTGDAFATLQDRVNQIMIVTKPIIHLTTDRPLVVDLQAKIAWGRPWFAYPQPDDFSIDVAMLQTPFTWTDGEPKEQEPPQWLEQFDRKDLATLPSVSEGYPWLSPSHRSFGGIGGIGNPYNDIVNVGLRWQNLIVTPRQQPWMKVPEIGEEKRFAWWQQLRDVPSCWVSNGSEADRFLYYDGPTLARSPIAATLDGTTLRVEPEEMFPEEVLRDHTKRRELPVQQRRGLFVEVQGKGITAYLVEIPEKATDIQLAEAIPIKGEEARDALLSLLVERGLTTPEARGLADSWDAQFFDAHGKRLITLLTSADYDAVCPLEVQPTPTSIVRVGLVLTEF